MRTANPQMKPVIPLLVSVIIPIYNGERYIAEAIKSVLNQTYRPLQVIVIDDGSTDRSADVVKRFTAHVRYVFQPHAGQAEARNHGVKLAEGSFFAFLDADDLWVEDKLRRQMIILDNRPELDMVFGHIKQFYSPELQQREKRNLHCPLPGYSVGTMLIRRDAFFQVGLFETRWKIGEFMDWYSKAQERGLKSLMRPEIVLKRRIHTANSGIRERGSRSDYQKILKAAIDRRRKASRIVTAEGDT